MLTGYYPGHGLEARGTTARMAVLRKAHATTARPVPSEVEGMAVPQRVFTPLKTYVSRRLGMMAVKQSGCRNRFRGNDC